MNTSATYQFIASDGSVGGIRSIGTEIQLFAGKASGSEHWSVPWEKWQKDREFAARYGENPEGFPEVVNAGLYFWNRHHRNVAKADMVREANQPWGH